MEVHVALASFTPTHTGQSLTLTHTTNSLSRRMHLGVEVTESSTNKIHHLSTHTTRSNPPRSLPNPHLFSVAARSRCGRPGTRANARPQLVLTPARQRSRRLTRCACLEILEQLDGAADWRGVAAQERARPGRWLPPCGLPCRAWLRGCIAPSAERIIGCGTFPRRSSTTRSNPKP